MHWKLLAPAHVDRTSRVLRIRPAPLATVVGLVSPLLVLAFMYSFARDALPDGFPKNFSDAVTGLTTGASEKPMLYIIGAVVLGSVLFGMVKAALTLLYPATTEFDSARYEVRRRGKKVGGYATVDCVQIRTIEDDDGPDTHRLSVRWQAGEKLHIVSSKNGEFVEQLAGDIADTLEKPVRRV